jgi:hypothetical protein
VHSALGRPRTEGGRGVITCCARYVFPGGVSVWWCGCGLRSGRGPLARGRRSIILRWVCVPGEGAGGACVVVDGPPVRMMRAAEAKSV